MDQFITLVVLFLVADYGLQPDGIVQLKKTSSVVAIGHALLVGFLPYLWGAGWVICIFLAMTHFMIDELKISEGWTVEKDQLWHLVTLVAAALMWRYAL